MHPAPEAERTRHRRHQRLVAVVADAELHLAIEVDALYRLEEAMDEVLPRLLAVGDDVDAGVLLRLEPDQGRVPLRLGERLALELPARPQFVRFGEPAGLRQAPGDRGFEHPPSFGTSHCIAAPGAGRDYRDDISRAASPERARGRRGVRPVAATPRPEGRTRTAPARSPCRRAAA